MGREAFSRPSWPQLTYCCISCLLSVRVLRRPGLSDSNFWKVQFWAGSWSLLAFFRWPFTCQTFGSQRGEPYENYKYQKRCFRNPGHLNAQSLTSSRRLPCFVLTRPWQESWTTVWEPRFTDPWRFFTSPFCWTKFPKKTWNFNAAKVPKKRHEISMKLSFQKISEIRPEVSCAFLVGRKVFPHSFTRYFSWIGDFKSQINSHWTERTPPY